MKIIFDSEEQKEKFMNKLISTSCPEQMGLEEESSCGPNNCVECWGQVEIEVKEGE